MVIFFSFCNRKNAHCLLAFSFFLTSNFVYADSIPRVTKWTTDMHLGLNRFPVGNIAHFGGDNIPSGVALVGWNAGFDVGRKIGKHWKLSAGLDAFSVPYRFDVDVIGQLANGTKIDQGNNTIADRVGVAMGIGTGIQYVFNSPIGQTSIGLGFKYLILNSWKTEASAPMLGEDLQPLQAVSALIWSNPSEKPIGAAQFSIVHFLNKTKKVTLGFRAHATHTSSSLYRCYYEVLPGQPDRSIGILYAPKWFFGAGLLVRLSSKS